MFNCFNSITIGLQIHIRQKQNNGKSKILQLNESTLQNVTHLKEQTILFEYVKTFTKKYLASLDEYKENPNPANLAIVTQNLSLTFSKIDKATKAKYLP